MGHCQIQTALFRAIDCTCFLILINGCCDMHPAQLLIHLIIMYNSHFVLHKTDTDWTIRKPRTDSSISMRLMDTDWTIYKPHTDWSIHIRLTDCPIRISFTKEQNKNRTQLLSVSSIVLGVRSNSTN